MKSAILLCLTLAVATQALDWQNVHPVRRTLPPRLGARIPPSAVNSERIIGGGFATVGQFPYQVAVHITSASFCGGSLITDSVILTAAHCIDTAVGAYYDIHLGATRWSNLAEEGRLVVRTSDALRHGSYVSLTISHDIAIIRLGQSVSGPNIGTVRLPTHTQHGAGEFFYGSIGRVSGWGKPADAAPGISDDLKFTDLEIVDNAICTSYYGGLNFGPGKLCTDTQGGTQSTCNGDSGGPLVVTESDGQLTQVGIVSFGSSQGCEVGAPAAFCRVTHYLRWLEDTAGIPQRP